MAMGSLAGVLAPSVGATVYAQFGLRGLALLTFTLTFLFFISLQCCACLSLQAKADDRDEINDDPSDLTEITTLLDDAR